jgi:hypothetical protein
MLTVLVGFEHSFADWRAGHEVPASERDRQESLGVEAIIHGLRISAPCYTGESLLRLVFGCSPWMFWGFWSSY